MNTCRIQKLLYSDYSDFEDIVLLESSFAETSKMGRGVRQIQMGLTPTKLILASYNIDPISYKDLSTTSRRRHDPEIDNFEIISAYPVECVNLGVFKKTKRCTLKVRFCNGKVMYLELSGWQEKHILWNMWCDRIKFLNPSDSFTTLSDNSVMTKSSCSTLYVQRSHLSFTKSGHSQLWRHHSKSKSTVTTSGSSCEIVAQQQCNSDERSLESKKSEECNQVNITLLANDGLTKWEDCPKGKKKQHSRRYAISCKPHFGFGLGIWPVTAGDAFSVQMKRAVSAVNLRAEPVDDTLILPLPRQLLKSSVSTDDLTARHCNEEKLNEHYKKSSSVLFWTPGFQYRPRTKRVMYRLVQKQLRVVKGDFPLELDDEYWKIWNTDEYPGSRNIPQMPVYKYYNVPARGDYPVPDNVPISRNSDVYTYLSREMVGLHEAMTLNFDITMWDMNTIVLAHQLIMIDRHLFLKIPVEELDAVLRHKFAPNFSAFMMFSHRTTCLVTTQVIKCITVQTRAHMIVKFIKIASYSDLLRNMQTARNVLCGLQSPAVFRLKHTWEYVRSRYYTKYSIFVELCRQYKDPRLPSFHNTFNSHSASPPSMPCATHIITILLGKMPAFRQKCKRCILADNVYKWKTTDLTNSKAELPSTLRKFFSANQIQTYKDGRGDGFNIRYREPNECKCINSKYNRTNQSVPDSSTLRSAQDFLKAGQEAAINYCLKTNMHAREFLLKAQYKEELDNFYASLRLECD
uniref:Ras-GEF domain-containing protein n=1 Tax=Clastoptera arizonana TaxID=38151 RepID=A0A1B6EA40_9HEMI